MTDTDDAWQAGYERGYNEAFRALYVPLVKLAEATASMTRDGACQGTWGALEAARQEANKAIELVTGKAKP